MSEIYEDQVRTPSDNGVFHIHPPLLAAGLLIVGLLLHLTVGSHQHTFPFHQFLGLLFVAVGSGLCCYAAALFAARETTKNPYGEPAAFVLVPPYTFTRNPMYLGFAVALFGFATFFGSPVMLLAPLVFAVVIDRMVIPGEEATMERVYGQGYRDYKGRVARWLPLPTCRR
jgi:protein-S-isoprenylcysteine O-methyltransferase Ste14